jgi:hypothetical protein
MGKLLIMLFARFPGVSFLQYAKPRVIYAYTALPPSSEFKSCYWDSGMSKSSAVRQMQEFSFSLFLRWINVINVFFTS